MSVRIGEEIQALLWQDYATLMARRLGRSRRNHFFESPANVGLTSDCEIQNFRAIRHGLTRALKAKRTEFRFLSVKSVEDSLVLGLREGWSGTGGLNTAVQNAARRP